MWAICGSVGLSAALAEPIAAAKAMPPASKRVLRIEWAPILAGAEPAFRLRSGLPCGSPPRDAHWMKGRRPRFPRPAQRIDRGAPARAIAPQQVRGAQAKVSIVTPVV